MQQHFHFFFVIPFSQISTRNLLPRTALKSVYPGVFPPMMERFFLCYGDGTPGNVKPSGEHDSCFGGGSSEWFAQGNVQAWAGLAGHYFFFSELLSSDVPLTCCVSCSAHTAFSRMLGATRPTDSDRHTHSLAVCSSRRKPRNCLWEYPGKLCCRKCSKILACKLSKKF